MSAAEFAPWAATVTIAATAAITWAVRLRPVPRPVARDAGVWRACHTTTCGHMTTRHDMTPSGLVCRGCGAVVGGAL